MKLALAMIVKGTKEEAHHLDTCLHHAKKFVDGIFVTFNTASGVQIDEACLKVAKKHGVVMSDIVWHDDFAEARNHSFAQVPSDFTHILWLDADDALRGGENMRKVLEKNDKDCYSMWYQYDFDEHKRPYITHQKIRVVKNDGSFEWRGTLHESLYSKRGVSSFLIEGSDVLHLSTKEHFEANKERNLRIALKDKSQHPDDPRSYYNTGNAYHANAQYENALAEFATFLATTQSMEEKYIAYLRVAEEYWNLGKRYEAVDMLRYAIGLKPNYPDAYTKMGMMQVNMKQYDEAVEYLTIALQLPHPQYSIVVFNPREYDFEPIRLLAIAHYELNQVDEALKFFQVCLRIYPKDKELQDLIKNIELTVNQNKRMQDKADLLSKLNDADLLKEMGTLKPDERSHPLITHLHNTRFKKTESSGRDLVIFCGYTSHEWNPRIAAEKGVGGSEEAVIHLAEQWTKMGWNVTVFNACGYQESRYQLADKSDRWVSYKPFWMWNYRDKQDVTILWRHPMMAQYEINSGKVLVDMHDVLEAGEFTDERLKHIDYVCFKTQAHVDMFPNIPGDKVRIIPNGIEPAQFNAPVAKEKALIINTSSPDRSLSACLDIYEEVKKTNPDARFEWAYGWDIFDAVHSDKKNMMEWKENLQRRMKELGVVEHGRLNTQQVAELYERGHVFLYPTGFYEIFCISAVKAQLAGAYPVCTDFAALGEVVVWGDRMHSEVTKDTWCKPYQFDFADKTSPEAWAVMVNKALANEPTESPVKDEIIKRYDWTRVSGIWHNIMTI